MWTRGPPSTSTPLFLVAFAALRPTRRKRNEGDGAVRAASRLSSAGSRAWYGRPWEVRNRGFHPGCQSRPGWHATKATGSGRPVGGLGSSWGSSRKAGRGFPALRSSVWVFWRAFGAVS